jgi:hypothetical protein
MCKRLRVSLLALIAIAPVSGPAQDIHIMLRPKEGKTSFHLGEPITVEAVCASRETNLYLAPCHVVLVAEPIAGGARLSANRLDQLTWRDAMNGSLPPRLRGACGTIDNPLPSIESHLPSWQDVTLRGASPVEQNFQSPSGGTNLPGN